LDDQVEIIDSDSDDDVQSDFELRMIEADPLWDSESFSFSKDLSRRQYKAQSRKKPSTPHQPAPKLRTSSDVYNRLIWDSSSGDPNDFAIGYEDRFLGLKEISLSAWKRDTSDKEFVSGLFLSDHCGANFYEIPFHRIVYFRQKSNDCIVWDRYEDFVGSHFFMIMISFQAHKARSYFWKRATGLLKEVFLSVTP